MHFGYCMTEAGVSIDEEAARMVAAVLEAETEAKAAKLVNECEPNLSRDASRAKARRILSHREVYEHGLVRTAQGLEAFAHLVIHGAVHA